MYASIASKNAWVSSMPVTEDFTEALHIIGDDAGREATTVAPFALGL